MSGKTKKPSNLLLRYCNTRLRLCPFCGGRAEFVWNAKVGSLLVRHLARVGEHCPASWEAYCGSVAEGLGWWNRRCWRGMLP
jgi:hypothetical protein